jgi:hypothetical protein
VITDCDQKLIHTQDLVKNFSQAGFKPQVKILTDFQETYGLEGEEDDEEIEVSGSDDDDESESGDEMEM